MKTPRNIYVYIYLFIYCDFTRYDRYQHLFKQVPEQDVKLKPKFEYHPPLGLLPYVSIEVVSVESKEFQ